MEESKAPAKEVMGLIRRLNVALALCDMPSRVYKYIVANGWTTEDGCFTSSPRLGNPSTRI